LITRFRKETSHSVLMAAYTALNISLCSGDLFFFLVCGLKRLPVFGAKSPFRTSRALASGLNFLLRLLPLHSWLISTPGLGSGLFVPSLHFSSRTFGAFLVHDALLAGIVHFQGPHCWPKHFVQNSDAEAKPGSQPGARFLTPHSRP
jgi:hypothetical protein